MTPAGIARDQLRAIVERIERLEEEKATIADDIKEIYAEAKANGYDTKTLRQVVRLRKQDSAERQEQEALLDLYMEALGMLADTPLGRAAVERAVASPSVKKAVKNLGTPVPLTEEEKEKGGIAAFEKDGTRMSISFPNRGEETDESASEASPAPSRGSSSARHDAEESRAPHIVRMSAPSHTTSDGYMVDEIPDRMRRV